MHDDERLTPEDPRREFLSAMAAALSRYGETADSLESGLQACARTLGVEVAFFSVPTAVFVAYGHGAAMHTVLLHTRDSAIDLQALSLLDETLLDVTRGRKSAAQGLAEVRLITASPLRFPWYMRVLASGLGAAAISVFLGGGVRELTAAIPVGLAVGALSVLARRVERLTSLVELLAGFLAAVLTLALGHVLPHFHLATVVLAGLILLLPGLSITLGVSELAARHLVSGSARLAGATVSLVSLGLGVAMGYAIFSKLGWVPPVGPGREIPGQWLTAAGRRRQRRRPSRRDQLASARHLGRALRRGRGGLRRARRRLAARPHRRRGRRQPAPGPGQQPLRAAHEPAGRGAARAGPRGAGARRPRLPRHLGVPAQRHGQPGDPRGGAGDRRGPRRGPARGRRDPAGAARAVQRLRRRAVGAVIP